MSYIMTSAYHAEAPMPRKQTREEIMDLIRERLHGKSIPMLSTRTGLSTATLYAIRRGKVRWPRHSTLDCLMDPLRLRLELKGY